MCPNSQYLERVHGPFNIVCSLCLLHPQQNLFYQILTVLAYLLLYRGVGDMSKGYSIFDNVIIFIYLIS